MGSKCCTERKDGDVRRSSAASLFSSGKPLLLDDSVFNKYDADGSGSLEVRELSALLKDAFPEDNVTDADLQAMMDSLDLDANGTIACNELRAFLRHFDPTSRKIKSRAALVIIDVQNDFITGSLANQYNAQDIVPIINNMRDLFEVVVISYDWHPYDHCSFAESVNEGKFPIKEEVKKFDHFTPVTLKADADREEHVQVLYPRHAVQDTEGSNCHADLVIKSSDLKVLKGTKPNIDSYSAFFDNCKANDTGLTAMLENERVTDVYCCGLVLDICVKSSALHGAEGGFKVFVIEDACKPLSLDNVAPTKQELESAGVKVISSAEAVAQISAKTELTLAEYCSSIKASAGAKSIHKETERRMSSHAVPSANMSAVQA